MELQWARLTPDIVVVVTPEHSWLHKAGFDSPFQGASAAICSRELLARLLDAALAAGQQAVGLTAERRPLTPERWVFSLCQSYQTTWATARLMARLAERFAALGRDNLADWARHKADEERGHYRLALADIRALGYDADPLVESVIPRRGAALARYFEAQVDAADPIRAVGYSYALERLALSNTRDHIEEVESMLPAGVMATRCLRVHSVIGADSRHVAEMVAFIATLSARERSEIVVGVYETAMLCSDFSEDEAMSHSELSDRLRGFSNHQQP